jgi:hypothetical protein
MLLGAGRPAQAGGGPENVFLVVNSQSWASLTLANRYILNRQIPSGNVLYLEWPGDPAGDIHLDAFRDDILTPILKAIQRRGLEGQIDYVIYSSDFPYVVNLATRPSGMEEARRKFNMGSLTGLTYLYQLTLNDPGKLRGANLNQYANVPGHPDEVAPSRAFSNSVAWDQDGNPVDAPGPRYLLSTMLGMTSGRGTSVGESIEGLMRSASVDGAHPQGTIYFVSNRDIRSKLRQKWFPATVAALKELGVGAEILMSDDPENKDLILPKQKEDIMGAMLGWAQFNWEAAGNTILPGAICENLTSFGGHLAEGRESQTPATDFLRFGASGTSGTVTEPGGTATKFPTPGLQVHYVRGCSLAESFYQSIQQPYQLLVLGDPLCRPWTNIPTVQIEGVESGQSVTGTLTMTPAAQIVGESEISHFELFVDGRRTALCAPGESIQLDTTNYVDGFHELRIVAIETSPIASQGRAIMPITTANHDLKVRLQLEGASPTWGVPLRLIADAPGAAQILLYQETRLLGTSQGEAASWQFPAEVFGVGVTRMRAVAISNQGGAVSEPLYVEIAPPPPLAPQTPVPDPQRLVDGMMLATSDQKTSVITDTSAPLWLRSAGVQPNQDYQLTGFFEVLREDLYQFQIRHDGNVTVLLDGREFLSSPDGSVRQTRYLPVPLLPGIHHVTIRGRAGDVAMLDLRYGGPGALRVDGSRFRHLGELQP